MPRAAIMRPGPGPSAFWTPGDRLVMSSAVWSISTSSLCLIPLIQDLQSLEREQLVGGLDGLGLGRDQRSQPAGSDAARGIVDLGANPLDERVDHAGIAVDEPRLHRLDRVTRDHLARASELDARQLGRVLVQRLARDLDPWCDHAAEVLALGVHDIPGRRGAEIDDNAPLLEILVRG